MCVCVCVCVRACVRACVRVCEFNLKKRKAFDVASHWSETFYKLSLHNKLIGDVRLYFSPASIQLSNY